MWPACFFILAWAHASFAESFITVYEGYTRGSQPVAGQLTGVPAHDRLLRRLPDTPRVNGEYLLEDPIFIQVPREDGHLATYFADQGLSSTLSEPLMGPIRDFLLQDAKVRALVYRPATFRDPRLLETNARELYIPDDFKIGDYLAVLLRYPQIPFFLVAGENYFNNLKLNDEEVKYIGKISLSVENHGKFIQAEI